MESQVISCHLDLTIQGHPLFFLKPLWAKKSIGVREDFSEAGEDKDVAEERQKIHNNKHTQYCPVILKDLSKTYTTGTFRYTLLVLH
jgi:hypothetical protein